MAAARNGHRPKGVSISLGSTALLEMTAKLGFEWLLVNQEHTLIGAGEMAELVRLSRAFGLTTLVKLNHWDPNLARDALDAGADGIQVPFIDSAEILLDVLKKPRGVCPVAPSSGYCSNARQERESYRFREKPLVVPMIETPTAIANLDEILAIPECPIFSIGIKDLSQYYRLEDGDAAALAEFHHVVDAAAAKIRAAGKLLMMIVPGPSRNEPAARRIDIPYVESLICIAYGLHEGVALLESGRTREPRSTMSAEPLPRER